MDIRIETGDDGTVALTPTKGQRWDCTLTGHTIRLMSDPIEGYVMARFKGAMPFVVSINDLKQKFTRKPL